MLAASRACRSLFTQPWRVISSSSVLHGALNGSNSEDAFPRQADVVIIGGGIAGCSLLYHLTQLGVTNAMILEKDEVTSGSTWHAAGILWHLRSSEIESSLLKYSWDLMKEMENLEGLSAGCQQNGSLFVANNKQRLLEYKRLAGIGTIIDVETHILSPQETKQLWPMMDVSEMYAAVHVPSDGGLDQSSLCQALVKGANRRGGRVFTDTAVTSIETEKHGRDQRKVSAVTTSRGRIETKRIVNCAGAWSPQIGRLAGVNVPLCPMKHAYIVTETIPGIRGFPNVRHGEFSLYMRTQGDSLMVGGYEPNPVPCEAEPNFAFSLYELDWEVFEQHLVNASRILPVLNETGVKTTVCGPESFTPDHKPLMGETPELRGFYLHCGFNSAGIMSGLGLGREMAAWLARGRPNLDMFSYDIRRFDMTLRSNVKWVSSRTHESYAKNFSVRFDRDEALAGRNVITDALFDELLAKGCIYQERQGMERPSWFQLPSNSIPAPLLDYDYYGFYGHTRHENYRYRDSLALEYTFDFPEHHDTAIARECHAARNAVALFNQSCFGKLFLVGPDAQKAADWIFSANVARPVGSTVYTCALNEHGGIEGDLTVSVVANGHGPSHAPTFNGERGFYLVTSGAARQYMYSHLQDVLNDAGFDCALLDYTHDLAVLSLQGPSSRRLLAQLTSADLSNEAFPFSTHQLIDVCNIPCRALRLSFVGELGWELHVPAEQAVSLYRGLMTAGADMGIRDAGFQALDVLSLEKGYKHWHGDIRTDDSPLEAGMAFTCKLKSQQAFLGRAALEAAKLQGPPRKRLVAFRVPAAVKLHGMEPVLRNGRVAGHLRRADFSPTLGHALGYGYVSNGDAAVDAAFLASGMWEVVRFGERFEATAHLRSLFDPENLRLKGIYDEEAKTVLPQV